MTHIEARASVQREPVHPSITASQVSKLVEHFYERVLASERLGPIFTEHAGANWQRHLDTKKRFWRSVLMRSGEYKGKPVPAHQNINGVRTRDFEEWLALFEMTTAEIFSLEAAPLVNEAAARIATSLWLARYTNPMATPPNWRMLASGRAEIIS